MLWLIVVFVILLIALYANPGFIGGADTPTFTLKEKWFDLMKAGKKTVEGRLYRGMFKGINEGDKVIIQKSVDGPEVEGAKPEELKATVTYVKQYDSPEALLKSEGVDKVMPGTSIEDALKNYDQYYNAEKIKEHGMVALGIKLEKK